MTQRNSEARGTIDDPIAVTNEGAARGEVRVRRFAVADLETGQLELVTGWRTGVSMATDELSGTMYTQGHDYDPDEVLSLDDLLASREAHPSALAAVEALGELASVIVEGASETRGPQLYERRATPRSIGFAYTPDDEFNNNEPIALSVEAFDAFSRDVDPDAFDYYFEDELGNTRQVRVIADDHRARGACSGIPECCVEAYMAGEAVGPADDDGATNSWGYAPCTACFEAESRVSILSCSRYGGGRCTCGQWLASEVVEMDDDPAQYDPPVCPSPCDHADCEAVRWYTSSAPIDPRTCVVHWRACPPGCLAPAPGGAT